MKTTDKTIYMCFLKTVTWLNKGK